MPGIPGPRPCSWAASDVRRPITMVSNRQSNGPEVDLRVHHDPVGRSVRAGHEAVHAHRDRIDDGSHRQSPAPDPEVSAQGAGPPRRGVPRRSAIAPIVPMGTRRDRDHRRRHDRSQGRRPPARSRPGGWRRPRRSLGRVAPIDVPSDPSGGAGPRRLRRLAKARRPGRRGDRPGLRRFNRPANGEARRSLGVPDAVRPPLKGAGHQFLG